MLAITALMRLIVECLVGGQILLCSILSTRAVFSLTIKCLIVWDLQVRIPQNVGLAWRQATLEWDAAIMGTYSVIKPQL